MLDIVSGQEFGAILGSGAELCSMYWESVRTCMCEAPSSAGTQNGPEVSGPYVEMTRNLRHREVAKCLRPMQRSQAIWQFLICSMAQDGPQI